MYVDFSPVISTLADLLGKLSANFSENIAYTSGIYTRATGFYLYVGVEGDVQYTDMRDVSSTRHFVVGYHPIRIKSITEAGTTATDLGACFN